MGRIKSEAARKREWLTLKFIVQKFWEKRTGTTYQEIVDFLGRELPPRPDGRPAVYSKQQSKRLVASLRRQGLIVKADQEFSHRSIVPTREAEELVKRTQ